MNSITIREATRADSKTILNFVTELAIYEKAEHEVKATEQTITDSIFSAETTTTALICENNGEPVGFAIYFLNYSTWLAKNGLFLEDLYVTPNARGIGVGKFILSHLAGIALAKNCGRFEWNVLDWNKPAIDFYDSLGAEPQNEWIGYRLTGDALQKLAKRN